MLRRYKFMISLSHIFIHLGFRVLLRIFVSLVSLVCLLTV